MKLTNDLNHNEIVIKLNIQKFKIKFTNCRNINPKKLQKDYKY